jgi:hypothetical protein
MTFVFYLPMMPASLGSTGFGDPWMRERGP